MERHTILVPTDFSTYAVQALQETLAIAARDKAQVLLLHVLPVITFPWAEAWPLARPQFEDTLYSDAEQQLQTLATQQTAPMETRVLWPPPPPPPPPPDPPPPPPPPPPPRLTGLAHVFIGSVAERVVRYAPCNVLIVRAFPVPQP
jgi:nucleotide-binding universal stress UspA family protein